MVAHIAGAGDPLTRDDRARRERPHGGGHRRGVGGGGGRAVSLLRARGDPLTDAAPPRWSSSWRTPSGTSTIIALANEFRARGRGWASTSGRPSSWRNRHPRVNIHQPARRGRAYASPWTPWFIVERQPENSLLIRNSREHERLHAPSRRGDGAGPDPAPESHDRRARARLQRPTSAIPGKARRSR